MAIRMMLVVLVAGLGLDLPSRGEIDAGGDGRSAGPVAPVTDQAFSAVVEEMVATFTAGQGREEAGLPAAEGEDLYPGLAYALNQEAEGLFQPLSPVTVAEVVVPPPPQEGEDQTAVMPPAPEAEEATSPAPVTELAVMPPAPEAEEATSPAPVTELAVMPPAPEAEEALVPGLMAEFAVMPPAPEADEPPTVEPAASSRGDRLVLALRLTGAAVHAWATFLQQAPGVVADRP